MFCPASNGSCSVWTNIQNTVCLFVQGYIIGSPAPPPGLASSPPPATSSSARAGWTRSASPAATRRSATGPGGSAPCPRRRCRAYRWAAVASPWPSSCRCWRSSHWRRLEDPIAPQCTFHFPLRSPLCFFQFALHRTAELRLVTWSQKAKFCKFKDFFGSRKQESNRFRSSSQLQLNTKKLFAGNWVPKTKLR